MKVRFHSLVLILLAALTLLAHPAIPWQPVFVQASQNRDQTENPQGLPPDKKRSLSRIGPEDVFSEQELNDSRQSRPRRVPQSAPRTNVAPIQIPIAPPVSTPSLQPERAIPAATISVEALGNQDRQQTLPPLTSSSQFVPKWIVPVLSFLAMIVFAALLFVLGKLRSLLRATS